MEKNQDELENSKVDPNQNANDHPDKPNDEKNKEDLSNKFKNNKILKFEIHSSETRDWNEAININKQRKIDKWEQDGIFDSIKYFTDQNPQYARDFLKIISTPLKIRATFLKLSDKLDKIHKSNTNKGKIPAYIPLKSLKATSTALSKIFSVSYFTFNTAFIISPNLASAILTKSPIKNYKNARDTLKRLRSLLYATKILNDEDFLKSLIEKTNVSKVISSNRDIIPDLIAKILYDKNLTANELEIFKAFIPVLCKNNMNKSIIKDIFDTPSIGNQYSAPQNISHIINNYVGLNSYNQENDATSKEKEDTNKENTATDATNKKKEDTNKENDANKNILEKILSNKKARTYILNQYQLPNNERDQKMMSYIRNANLHNEDNFNICINALSNSSYRNDLLKNYQPSKKNKKVKDFDKFDPKISYSRNIFDFSNTFLKEIIADEELKSYLKNNSNKIVETIKSRNEVKKYLTNYSVDNRLLDQFGYFMKNIDSVDLELKNYDNNGLVKIGKLLDIMLQNEELKTLIKSEPEIILKPITKIISNNESLMDRFHSQGIDINTLKATMTLIKNIDNTINITKEYINISNKLTTPNKQAWMKYGTNSLNTILSDITKDDEYLKFYSDNSDIFNIFISNILLSKTSKSIVSDLASNALSNEKNIEDLQKKLSILSKYLEKDYKNQFYNYLNYSTYLGLNSIDIAIPLLKAVKSSKSKTKNNQNIYDEAKNTLVEESQLDKENNRHVNINEIFLEKNISNFLDKQIFERLNLSNKRLERISFVSSKINNIESDNTRIINCNFNGAEFNSNVNIANSYIQNTSFESAKLNAPLIIKDSELENVKFQKIKSNSITIDNSILDSQTFKNLIETKQKNPSLKIEYNNTKVTGDLKNFDLSGLNLKGLDFSSITSLSGTNIYNTNIDITKVRRDILDSAINLSKKEYDSLKSKINKKEKLFQQLTQKFSEFKPPSSSNKSNKTPDISKEYLIENIFVKSESKLAKYIRNFYKDTFKKFRNIEKNNLANIEDLDILVLKSLNSCTLDSSLSEDDVKKSLFNHKLTNQVSSSINKNITLEEKDFSKILDIIQKSTSNDKSKKLIFDDFLKIDNNQIEIKQDYNFMIEKLHNKFEQELFSKNNKSKNHKKHSGISDDLTNEITNILINSQEELNSYQNIKDTISNSKNNIIKTHQDEFIAPRFSDYGNNEIDENSHLHIVKDMINKYKDKKIEDVVISTKASCLIADIIKKSYYQKLSNKEIYLLRTRISEEINNSFNSPSNLLKENNKGELVLNEENFNNLHKTVLNTSYIRKEINNFEQKIKSKRLQR